MITIASFFSPLSRVRHASLPLLALALAVVLPELKAQTIPNPSFESNTFTAAPGYVSANTAITSWTGNPTTRVGLNVAGNTFFANNGTIPNGTKVAFIESQGGTSILSTTITGLVAGTSYRVQFRANGKTSAADPVATVRLNGGDPVSFAAPPVGGSNAYGTVSAIFTATATTAALEVSNSTILNSALLVDNFTITAATTIQVTKADNDGPGSLRQALASAAATPALNVITFAPALSGQTITLFSEIAVNDTVGVIIDASALSAGITISGGDNTRIFTVANGTAMFLRKVTLAGGNGNGGASGGAIHNAGALTLTQCTLSGNASTDNGGAISNSGQLSLTQCTLSGNAASNNGGGIRNCGTLTLTHCTISGNSADSAGGAGGAIDNSGTLTLSNTIVAGNTGPAAEDIVSGANATLNLVGTSIVPNLANTGATIGSGTISNAAPVLDTLADNGGGTKTMALNPGSPARNAAPALSPPITSDQRGKAIQGAADIGAFEVQKGTFVFSQTGYSVNESAGPAVVTIKRTGGFEGTASVNISAVAGTATAADFTAITNQTVNFLDGQISKDVLITIAGDALAEANETFTVTLSTPSAGSALGTPASAKVTIVDASSTNPGQDTTPPGTPVITTPAAAAMVNPNADGTVTVTGTAADNKGVAGVNILDGNNVLLANAILDSPNAASTNWTATIPVSAGTNTIKVQSMDLQTPLPNTSPFATRTFKVTRPLVVQISGNGSVTAGFSPSSFREVGQMFLITATPAATPAPGNIFKSWTIESGHSTGELGIALSALEKPTLNFIQREGLVLRANFVPNPFVALGSNSAGTSGVEYNGLIHADRALPNPNGTPQNNSTEGLLTATVTSTGGFSAKLTIDGSALNMAGAFDQNGVARFGTSRATTFAVARVNKPSLIVALTINLCSSRQKDTIRGIVTATSFQRSVITAVSNVTADRAFYDGLTPATTVPAAYLGSANATQSYTVVLPSRAPYETSTMQLYGDPYDDVSLPNGAVGDRIVFEDPAPIGLTAGDFYTLVDDINQPGYFVLQDGNGDPAPIDASYDSNDGTSFTVILDPVNHQSEGLGLATEDYAQGDGYALLTISKAGLVTLSSGKLADGTAVTGSSKLSKDNKFPLFLQLYNKLGYLSGDVQLDSTNSKSDLASVNLDWLRPFDPTSQYYPYGWAEVIRVGFQGARYAAAFSPASSVLRSPDGDDDDQVGDALLPGDPVNGNAALSFFDGQLTEELNRMVSISATNAVTKVPASDTSFTLTLSATTGVFTGTFVHENDDGVPAPLMTNYEGVSYQKGTGAGGYGFFLTRKPTLIDYTGESGAVNLFGFGQ